MIFNIYYFIRILAFTVFDIISARLLIYIKTWFLQIKMPAVVCLSIIADEIFLLSPCKNHCFQNPQSLY